MFVLRNLLLLSLLLLLGVWSQPQSFLKDVREIEDIDSFLTAMQISGQFDLVNDAKIQQTIFVPKKEVFKQYFKTIELGLSDPDNDFSGILQFVIPTHIVPGINLLVEDFQDNQKLTTAGGHVLSVQKKGGRVSLRFNDIVANIVQSDLQAGNTMFHVIDAVIVDEEVDVFLLPTELLTGNELQSIEKNDQNVDLSGHGKTSKETETDTDEVTCPTCA
eukprot:TRINITY_DN18129_c0_g1_i6.p3 TRINITY_DN18129_c0_g1~~TRINITY_DN18129_c0_g1_i6.p3  ORF type:complete len:218 (+),score=37.66 TRINITY_DN18129_c0_g1_i6:88-741(+)